MKKLAAILLFIFILTPLFSVTFVYAGVITPSPTTSPVSDETIDRVKLSVVAIYADPGLQILRGSGFFIDSKGLILTNYHVIEQYPHLWGLLFDGRSYELLRVFPWPDKDLAILIPILKGPEITVNFPHLKFAKASDLKIGENVASVGHSWGGTWQVIRSHIIEKISYRYNDTWSVTPNILGGFSGSPLFDSAGEVVGINAFSADRSESHEGTKSYAISVIDIKIFLAAFERNELPSAEKPRKLYQGDTFIGNCIWRYTKEGQWCRH